MSARVLVVDDSATVRRLVCTILSEAGFSVSGSADGADALERVQRERFDLVLVDFVMPRLNGFQLAQAVRSVPSLRALPLVLMSARADAIAERFMAATGSAAWLSKPFSPSALLATVREALAMPQAEPTRSDDEPRPSAERSLVQAVPLVSRRTPSSLRAQTDPPQAVARALLPALRAVGVSLELDALVRALGSVLVGRVPSELAAALEDLAGPRPSLEGRLEHVPLGEVFQLLALQGQTGVLRIERGGASSARSVSLAIRAGRLDGCAGGAFDEDLRVGRFLVTHGVSRAAIERAASAPRAAGELLGERLLSSGEASVAQLTSALEQQCRELVYECLTWSEGRFRYDAGASLISAQRARLGLVADALVMEGMRRIDEWRVMRAMIPSDALVLSRTEGAEATVPDEDRPVLREIDGVRAVRDIGDALGMSRFDVCQALCRLMQAKLLSVAA